MSHSPTKRRHDLDALRAIAMMLGIVLHAAIAYTGFGWAISDPSHSRAFIYLFDAVHGFRMQLFFFISGYFTTMLYFKRGMRGLLYQRSKRILVPLLLFAPLLSPLTQWIINQAKGESQATLFPETLPFWQSFNLHHLWFLWFLVLFALFFACWNWLKIPQKLAFFSKNYSGALYLVALSIIPQSFMTTAYPLFGPCSSLTLLPDPTVFTYYAIFFAAGASSYSKSSQAFAIQWKLLLPCSLFILFPLGIWIEHLSIYQFSYLKPLSDCIQLSYTWCMVYGSIGLFKNFCSSPSPHLRYLSDSSYWLYLAHLPLVFGTQLLLVDVPMSCWIKFPIVVLTCFALLLVSYHFLIRDKWLGNLLNGK